MTLESGRDLNYI